MIVNIQGSSINQISNNTMSVMLWTGATFVKKNSCLVAIIVYIASTRAFNLLTRAFILQLVTCVLLFHSIYRLQF